MKKYKKLEYLRRCIRIEPTMTVKRFNQTWKRVSAPVAQMQGEMR